MTISTVPAPVSAVSGGPGFVLRPDTPLSAAPGCEREAAWWRRTVGPATGCAFPPGAGGVTLRLDPGRPHEGYALRVGPSGVDLAGGSPAGVFRGLQTLRQLLPPAALRRAAVAAGPWPLPGVRIADAPRFAWRGVLLDVARHFLPPADVLRFVDLAAFHQLNVLHLHLTDDQGWRLPVPGWPRLTTVGAWRASSSLGDWRHGRDDGRPHGGAYSEDDLREIVAYAAERHITVVPEVDLPGHMQAAIAAYPELGNGLAADPRVRTAWGIATQVLNVSDTALGFCRDVLDQVCALFPGDYVGIGGDECPKDEWRASPAAQERMRALGLPDEDALQSWFLGRVAEHLASRGRRVYGWDEILEGGAPPGATVAAWRGPGPAVLAARAGHDVVACPDTAVYLDYRQSADPGEPTPVGTELTLADVYAFDPVPPGLPPELTPRVIGAQANVWTEHMESARRIDYMAFPRLCAFAEVAWGTGGDYAGFAARLGAHLARLDALGVEYRPLDGPRPWHARPDAPGRPRSRAERLAEVAEMTANLDGA
ncbi:beta-N-acetylhexosaminidase [Spirilliplanes yamanashiensis]|uniref:beta-N-acetylhexosaminidase n=1 Tax=Spirilliplanes yamanashiensis TaxID=42233 RepID=A0A8J4DL77_9ACTN|nr:beta-N-acetylhexosaminidase [Spirilliplanes yamanashiensis]MDP9818642.1 hexosaminidase [Spirilliplanes yamanashiensis]GIJ05098.1 beta-N-acetylhexosaminidase [Spirilliplanes yamanashiensis]